MGCQVVPTQVILTHVFPHYFTRTQVRLILEFCDKGCLRDALQGHAFLGGFGLNYRAVSASGCIWRGGLRGQWRRESSILSWVLNFGSCGNRTLRSWTLLWTSPIDSPSLGSLNSQVLDTALDITH